MKECGLSDGDKCNALNKKDCEGCSFFKTPEQLKRDRRAIAERLKKKGLYVWAIRNYFYLKELEGLKKIKNSPKTSKRG